VVGVEVICRNPVAGRPGCKASATNILVSLWLPSQHTVDLLRGRSVKLLTVLTSTVILGFGSRRYPWPYFSFQDFHLFWNGASSLTRGGVWLPFTGGDSSGHSLTNWPSPPHTHMHTHARSLSYISGVLITTLMCPPLQMTAFCSIICW
jgi:hypothetical protein